MTMGVRIMIKEGLGPKIMREVAFHSQLYSFTALKRASHPKVILSHLMHVNTRSDIDNWDSSDRETSTRHGAKTPCKMVKRDYGEIWNFGADYLARIEVSRGCHGMLNDL